MTRRVHPEYTYRVVKRADGWAVRREWKEHRTLLVASMIEGSIQYGHDGEAGAFCSVYVPPERRSVTRGQDMLGLYSTQRSAQKVADSLTEENQ